jgi:dihydrofolate reductase
MASAGSSVRPSAKWTPQASHTHDRPHRGLGGEWTTQPVKRRTRDLSAAFFDAGVARVGAAITGRRTYDVSEAWGGSGPMPGIPLFVVTYHVPATVPTVDPPYTFVADGVESAVEQARTAAAGKDVFLQGASIVQQALRVGLMDEFTISLVPVVLGRGVRLLDGVDPGSVALDLLWVIDAPGVTHLTYRVVK